MKKLILLLLVFFPMMVFAYPSGDVNGNDKVDSTDYLLIRLYLFKTSTMKQEMLERADVNNDGKVNSLDYVIIRKIIMGRTSISPSTVVSSYVITDDLKYSSYSNIVSCSSDTLKYRIIEYNKQDIVLIWVKDANNQLGSALASNNGIGVASAEKILNTEIATYGYQNKCMVAVNASFFDMSTGEINAGVLINRGRTLRNNSFGARGTIGVNKEGILKQYSETDNATNLLNDGVKNNFRASGVAYGNQSEATANRTQICQLDNNNYVLISGSGTVGGVANYMYSLTGCYRSWNLDGGGSRKLYYKNKESAIMTKRFGGGREITDMLYFVE